ncbi:hypothetical protein A3731_06155 [Roseovarius sp. HI0049]|nr:hypothetical protein A3731_32755 [Roseovarius sp. HI0049]KZY48939.1 hypothetical protein A3731_06155 [Roseovarius sp. HI0049]
MKHKTITPTVVAFLTVTGISSANAGTLSPMEQAQAFATCAGRLQALATRQGATHDPQSTDTRQKQYGFEDLLDALLPHVTEAEVAPGDPKRWRAHGWTEIALLLRHAQYEADDTRAARARADMARRIDTCTRMIL